MTWLTDILRSIFFLIDRVVYFFIDTVYALFIEIANTTLFTDEMIEAFAGKVYALVGIFMLFKVSFSILTYIVNPDEFADKNKGMSKLITNILTSLVLLIAVPFIFKEAMDIQRIILKDDIIPKIFSTSDINISSQDPGQGSEMASITFKAFYDVQGNYSGLGEIFSTDVNAKNASGDYVTEYTLIISTAVGIVLVLLLISFCFDIALRSIKLGFLRMLAPIPIIARVDPKKGNELFSKWTKTCVSTYLDLFMRLAAIFFAIYIIKAVQISVKEGGAFADAVTGLDSNPSTLTMVFIILGALMFAKQLPKLIEDLLGIKLSGSFSLNPLKKLEEIPLAGKPLASATRFAGRTAGTMFAGAGALAGMAAKNIGYDISTSKLGRDVTRGINWMKDTDLYKDLAYEISGTKAAIGASRNAFANSEVGSRIQRDMASIANDAQSTLYGAIGGIPGTGGLLSGKADKFDKQIKTLEEYAKFKSRLKDQADYDTTDLRGNSDITTIANGNASLIAAAEKGAKGLKQYFEDLKNSGTASVADITQARKAWETAQEITITTGANDSIKAIKSEAARYVQSHRDILSGADYSTDENASYDNINSGYIKAQNTIVSTKSSQEYQAAQARKTGVPKGK